MSRPAVRERFLRALPFALDEFQIEALDALDSGASVMVAAPTGSGKTVVAEYAVEIAVHEKRRVFYTAPIKALSNQKYNDLRERLGDDLVGLLTGDHSIRDDAPVIVMTTEVLRNMIYARSPAIRDLRYVVLDEVHFLQDPYRGPVWEEVIIHLPQEVDLVCLSATVSNATEIADWITTVRGKTVPVLHDVRPIELQHMYLATNRSSDELLMLPMFVNGRPNPQAAKLDVDEDNPFRRGPRSPIVTPRRTEVLDALYIQDMLPAITFIFSRSGCDEAVQTCLREGLRLTSPAERKAIGALIDDHVKNLSKADLKALDYSRFRDALMHGFAAHHAGMVPPFREAVEACFVEGLVKAVFATETLALGINMPARTVVIEKLSKFGGERHKFLTPAEFTQLTGRAGRRGIDPLGYAAVLWSPFVPFEQVAGLAAHKTYELRSVFRPTNNMAINLVRRYGPTEAHHLLGLSLAQFQIDRDLVANRKRIDQLAAEIDEASRFATCDLGDVHEYVRLREKRSARPGASEQVVEHALEALRPGDVLAPLDERGNVVEVSANARPGDGWVLVVATVRRKGRPITLRAVGPSGKLTSLTARDFRSEPQVITSVKLPTPFNLNSRAFVSSATQSLQKVMQKAGVAGVGKAGKRGVANEGLPGSKHRERKHPEYEHPEHEHPVARCPDLTGHLRAVRRLEILQPEVDRLTRVASSRSTSLSDEFDRLLQLLEALGYLDGWSVTADGEVLSGIFHESDLLIAECIMEGVFDGLQPVQVAALASVFVFESRGPGNGPATRKSDRAPRGARQRERGLGRGRDGERLDRVDLPPGFPKILTPRWWTIAELHADLAEDLAEHQLPPIRETNPGFVSTAHRWASGEVLGDVLHAAELDAAATGGDFVRTIKSLVDLLRQIATVAPLSATRSSAAAAADLLFRGVVSASKVNSDLAPSGSTETDLAARHDVPDHSEHGDAGR